MSNLEKHTPKQNKLGVVPLGESPKPSQMVKVAVALNQKAFSFSEEQPGFEFPCILNDFGTGFSEETGEPYETVILERLYEDKTELIECGAYYLVKGFKDLYNRGLNPPKNYDPIDIIESRVGFFVEYLGERKSKADAKRKVQTFNIYASR